MSLFSTNIIFDDRHSNACDQSFDNDLYEDNINNIESDIINMIDEDHQVTSNQETISSQENGRLAIRQKGASKKGKMMADNSLLGVMFEQPGSQRTSSTNSTHSSDRQDDKPSPPIPSLSEKLRMRKINNHKPNPKQFSFPEGGWECSECQNYNFKGRTHCYRCKKEKTDLDSKGKPQHMGLSIQKKEAIRAARKALGPEGLLAKQNNMLQNQSCPDQGQTFDGQQGSFKQGDWACYSCHSFNYQFNDNCYKCQSSQFQSNQSQGFVSQQSFNMQAFQPIAQQFYPQVQISQFKPLTLKTQAFVPKAIEQQ